MYFGLPWPPFFFQSSAAHRMSARLPSEYDGAMKKLYGAGLILPAFAFGLIASGIGQVARERHREIRDLVFSDKADHRFGVVGAVALNDDRALIFPFFVKLDRALGLVAVVDDVGIQHLAVDAAVGVDPGERVDLARAGELAGARRRAGVVEQVADFDLLLGERRRAPAAVATLPRAARFYFCVSWSSSLVAVFLVSTRMDRASSMP